MARRRFNPNQKRDKNGRWTSGGGGGGAKTAKASRPARASKASKAPKSSKASKAPKSSKPGSKTSARQAHAKKIQRRRNVAVGVLSASVMAYYGKAALGHGVAGTAMAKKGRYVMASAHGVAGAAALYAGASNAGSMIVRNSRKISAQKKATFERRRQAVDKQVVRVAKTANAVLAGGYLLQVLGPVAAHQARAYRARKDAAANSGPAALMAGLKVTTKGRGGAYNISGFKGKRV